MPQEVNKRGGRAQGSNRGGGTRRGPLNRNVQISKNLSWLLRHGARSVGVDIDSGGWVKVEDALKHVKLNATFNEVKEIVRDNEKKRFQIIPLSSVPSEGDSPTNNEFAIINLITLDIESPDDPGKHLIRATQGHSLKSVEATDLLTPILTDDVPSKFPELVVHGTTPDAWHQIEKTGGLKPMSRQHVHFATRVPGIGEKVVSGMRASATILIWVDLKRSSTVMKWWTSANGVILTDGKEKIVPLEFVDRVEERKKGGIETRIIWPLSKVPDGN